MKATKSVTPRTIPIRAPCDNRCLRLLFSEEVVIGASKIVGATLSPLVEGDWDGTGGLLGRLVGSGVIGGRQR